MTGLGPLGEWQLAEQQLKIVAVARLPAIAAASDPVPDEPEATPNDRFSRELNAGCRSVLRSRHLQRQTVDRVTGNNLTCQP